MNDPNGLVYYKGQYHMFYQYYPYDKIWGPMHWGHAVSEDLIRWEELDIALKPDSLGQIFSGSAVVDVNNTSELKNGDEDVLVSIFTHHGEDNEKQSIAYSNNAGKTWEKYDGNPVIENQGLKDFRDPKVMWHEESGKWIMTLACGDHIQFYSSLNLKEWEYLSSFGEGFGTKEGVWECPDLLHLNIDGQNKKAWVLIVSVNPGGPNGGSAAMYFIGDFDGSKFVCNEHPSIINWADYGRDFYAAVTWSNTVHEDPIWIAWMSNWQYANEVPTENFRSAMSLPRSLKLKEFDNKYLLSQTPIDLDVLKDEAVISDSNFELSEEEIRVQTLSSDRIWIKTKVDEIKAKNFSLQIAGKSNFVEINFDIENKEIKIDRTNCGNVSFSKLFPSIDKMPIEEINDIEIIIDNTSIELFVNEGTNVMTELFFMPETPKKLIWTTSRGNVRFNEYSMSYLKSIWK